MKSTKPVSSGSMVESIAGTSALSGARFRELFVCMCVLASDLTSTSRHSSGCRWGGVYIKHRRTSSLRNTPSLEDSCSGCCTANKPNASRISASWSAVKPFSFASLDTRFVGKRGLLGGARRFGGLEMTQYAFHTC
jgi:hypothetical protein